MSAMPTTIRPYTRESEAPGRAALFVGRRGVGKTTYLLYHMRGRRFLYVSADSPRVADTTLYELGAAAFMAGYEGLVVDEVHFARDWAQHLKALYDEYPHHTLWASDSSSLVLRQSAADLSRRFVRRYMPLLSFREYVLIKANRELPRFDPLDPSYEPGTGQEFADAELLSMWHTYREEGTRPFFGQGNFSDRMLAVLEKTIHSDIPFFLPQITDGNLRLMNAVISTLAHSNVPRLQVRSLCADWHISAEKLYQLLFVMESVGLLRVLRYPHDRKAATAGRKLFFSDPVLYTVLRGNEGTAREAWAAAMIAEHGHHVATSRDEQKGDLVIDDRITLEIGGRTKSRKQADIVVREDIDTAGPGVLPLWQLACW